jgi:hypothetical protein
MLASYKDVTAEFNANNAAIVDASNWDYVVVQFISPSGTIAFTATNDSGDVEGVTDGNASLAVNFVTVVATKLSDGTLTATGAAGLFRFAVVGRYIKFGGASAAATKVIVQFAKIS